MLSKQAVTAVLMQLAMHLQSILTDHAELSAMRSMHFRMVLIQVLSLMWELKAAMAGTTLV